MNRFNPRTGDQSKVNRPQPLVGSSQSFNRPPSRVPRPLARGGMPADISLGFSPSGAASTATNSLYPDVEGAEEDVGCGVVKPPEPQWLLNPPAPERIAEHLRTGRAQELRSKSTRDRLHAASYMEEALRQRLRNKLKASAISPAESSST